MQPGVDRRSPIARVIRGPVSRDCLYDSIRSDPANPMVVVVRSINTLIRTHDNLRDQVETGVDCRPAVPPEPIIAVTRYSRDDTVGIDFPDA